MSTEARQFKIKDLVKSVVDAVSSYSEKSADTIKIIINDETSKPLYGETKALQRALIIVVEHALIHRPNIPVILSCSVIKKSTNLATLLFWVTQYQHNKASISAVDSRYHNENISKGSISTKLSLEIAERLINKQGGDLLIRPQHPFIHEIFVQVPMELKNDHVS